MHIILAPCANPWGVFTSWTFQSKETERWLQTFVSSPLGIKQSIPLHWLFASSSRLISVQNFIIQMCVS